MQIINKIGILINWPREFDMYQELIKYIPKNKIELIINDVSSVEKGRSSQAEIIKSILIKKDLSYNLFSNVYKKKKFQSANKYWGSFVAKNKFLFYFQIFIRSHIGFIYRNYPYL